MARVEVERLLHVAAQSPVHEICGLLFGSPDRIESAASAANVAADPQRQFELDPAALLAAYRRERAGGPAVIGHYHSHPGGPARPSATDAASVSGTGRLWLILGRGEAALFREAAGGPLHGAFEPVALTLV